jgi:hypothetical protein
VKCGLAQFDRLVEAVEPKERVGLRLKAHAIAGVEGKRAIDLGRCLLVLGAREKIQEGPHAGPCALLAGAQRRLAESN